MRVGLGVAAAVLVAAAPLPGARAVKICAAAGPYWPTMTLALRGSSAWIACKEQSRVIRVDTRTGGRTRSVRLGAPVIAVASGVGSIWALDSGATLYRLNASSGTVVRRIALPAAAPYNIWIGGGSVWVAADQGAQVVRVSPRTNRVVARIPVGDGPADMAFDGGTAWVVNHRDRVLSRIDLGTNRSTKLTTLDGDAPERMVWARGSL
jgi:DNA-binding beta-propeller fold protein YncE